jgi:predicted NBD/HSP70 family sugar kinase
VPRGQIARRLGLSPATLSRLTKPLIEAGLLFEVDPRPPEGRGRPSRPLDIDPSSRHFIGVKITAEKAHGVLTDIRAKVIDCQVAPFAERSPEGVVKTVAELAASLGSQVGQITALGVSAAGLTKDYQILRHAPYLGWEPDVPLAAMLREATGLATAVDNDVAAWTEAERWFGDGRDRPDFALVTTGAGVGYNLVTHRHRASGPDVGVGLLGHVPLDPLGPLCSAGHQGCAEAMLTTGALAARVSAATGRPVTYERSLELAAQGDPAARAAVTAAARAYGRLLALIANTTFVPFIIASGEGVDLAIAHRDLVRDEFAAGRSDHASPVEILLKPAPFTEWARGAAVVAIQTYVLGRA